MAENKTAQKIAMGRSAGVLLPVTALYGPMGIGTMGEETLEFIDWLSKCGFHCWQILPLEHTGEFFSPYQCVSAFAGNPLLIDGKGLLQRGLLSEAEYEERIEGAEESFVDYPTVQRKQMRMLKQAYKRLAGKEREACEAFCPDWLDDYALYMVLRERYGCGWQDWPKEALRMHGMGCHREGETAA